jgi:hypothetical protein
LYLGFPRTQLDTSPDLFVLQQALRYAEDLVAQMPGEPSAHIALNIAKKRFEAAEAKAKSGEGTEGGEGGEGAEGGEGGEGGGELEGAVGANGAFEDSVAEMDADDRLQAEGADDEAEDGGGRANMEEEDKAPVPGGATAMDDEDL